MSFKKRDVKYKKEKLIEIMMQYGCSEAEAKQLYQSKKKKK